jgi:curved DNA-binding protein CbpA
VYTPFLTNYYDILGVSQEADSNEIKAAFRRLAKQFHPDKNPNGKEFFERALLAYETLSDPALKAAYDYRLKSHAQHSTSAASEQKKAGKNWKFDERELKRRQYYNEHIRKYAKETASYNAKAEQKKTYNEYKYILFATPLAVALFVMIMKLAGPVMPKRNAGNITGQDARLSTLNLKPGDAPYNFIFGNPYYDMAHNKSLVIKNLTGLDAIVCIFSKGRFIRSFFVQGGFSAEVSQLPRAPLDIRYVCGEKFSYHHTLKKAKIEGGFTSQASYYRSISELIPADRAELSLYPGINEGFTQTSEKEFFITK